MSSPNVFVLLLLLLVFLIAAVAASAADVSLPAGRSSSSANGTSGAAVRRSKRYLDFIPLTRMFFRANIKDNVQRWNNFWAQGYGYRANYVIENRRRTKRSEVYDTLAELISQHGFDGRACILKSFCEASKALTPTTGIVFKLFKLFFSDPTKFGLSSGSSSLPDGDDVLYPYLKSDNCEELSEHCPLSLLGVTRYTDD